MGLSRAWIYFPLWVGLASPLWGEPRPGPEYSEDFETSPTQEGIYDGWERIRSATHPFYNRITLEHDKSLAHAGERYLSMITQGAFTAFQMTPRGAWRIEPGRSYRLTVYARLVGTRKNTAWASLVFMDRRFRPLRTESSSPLRTTGGWRPLTLESAQAPEGASWVAVRLEFGGEDVRGECSFDSVRLDSPAGLLLEPLGQRLPVFEAPAKPRFRILPSQLPAGDHWIDLTVTGVSGADRIPPRRLSVVSGGGLTLELPLAERGAYTLAAKVSGPSGLAASASIPFVILGPAWMASDKGPRLFGGIFDPLAHDYQDPGRLARLGDLRSAQVLLWREPAAGEAPPPPQARILDFVRELGSDDRLELTGVLAQVPSDLFADLDPATRDKGLKALLGLGRRIWESPLKTTVSRYREFIPFWQIGDRGPCCRLATEAFLKAARFEPNYEPLTLREGSGPSLLKALVAYAASGSKGPAFVPLDSLMVDPRGYPAAALLALRAANGALSGATPRGDLAERLGAPVRFAFEKDGKALLALWSDQAEIEKEVHWGEEAEVFEPWGAVRRLKEGERLRVGSSPFFVGNVETLYLESLSSLELVDPASPGKPMTALPIRSDPQVRLLRFKNLSFDQEMSNLRFRLAGELPANWIVRPVAASSPPLGPQKELAQELTFTLPPTQEESRIELPVELTFVQGGRDRMIRRSLSIDLVAQIGIEVEVMADPASRDARKVRVSITNRTSRPVSLVASIRLPRQPERTELLGPITPGFAADRSLEYRVKELSLVEPARRRIEILCEERGGERLHARKVVVLE